MPEKLSQEQIDALLNRISSGEEVQEEAESTQKKIKEYDFRSPKKFTKEQLRTLDSMHENFSRMLSSYFSGTLRSFCEVSVLAVEEQRYFEYNNALPDTALIGLMDLHPADDKYSDGTLIMDVSTSIGFFMIDRLLGGNGSGYNLMRDFTDIEINILHSVFEKIVKYLQDAWHSYIDVQIDLTDIQTNSRLLQALAPEDIVVIAVLDVKIKDISGTINICIPATNLEEMIDNFSIKYSRATAKRQNSEKVLEEKRKIIFSSLENTDLEIKAVLADTQLDLKDVLQLQPSDVIMLNKNINSDIEITVDDIPWFTAKLGEAKNKKAVKITHEAAF